MESVYAIEFSTSGTCTWYQNGYSFDGTYYWSNQENCYYLNMREKGIYANTTFKAEPTSEGLIVSGGTVNHYKFTKDFGSDTATTVTIVLVFLFSVSCQELVFSFL